VSAEVELLREAARTMRSRAEAANTTEARRPYGDRDLRPVSEAEWGDLVDNYLGGEVGAHCASWHPAAALAVADWLDGIAHACADYIQDEPCQMDCWHSVCAVNRGALAVARAYLGRES
jgi:hypothetical protein